MGVPYIPHSYVPSRPHSHADDVIAVLVTFGCFAFILLLGWVSAVVDARYKKRVWQSFAHRRGLRFADGVISGVVDGVTLTLTAEMRRGAHTAVWFAIVRCALGTHRIQAPDHDLRGVCAYTDGDVLVVESRRNPFNHGELHALLRQAAALAKAAMAAPTA